MTLEHSELDPDQDQDNGKEGLSARMKSLEGAIALEREIVRNLRDRVVVLEIAAKWVESQRESENYPLRISRLLWTPCYTDQAPRLNVFHLNDDLERRSFLATLYLGYGTAGIVAATNHVWSTLAEPKASRVEAIGRLAGVTGRSIRTIRHVLEKFLNEADLISERALLDKQYCNKSEEGKRSCPLNCLLVEKTLGSHFDRYSTVLNG